MESLRIKGYQCSSKNLVVGDEEKIKRVVEPPLVRGQSLCFDITFNFTFQPNSCFVFSSSAVVTLLFLVQCALYNFGHVVSCKVIRHGDFYHSFCWLKLS